MHHAWGWYMILFMDSLAILSTLERRFSLGLKEEECERLAALPPAARRGRLTALAAAALRSEERRVGKECRL